MPTPTYDIQDLLPAGSLTNPVATGLDPFAVPDVVDALSRRYFFFGRNENIRVWDGTTLKIASGTAPAVPVAALIAGSPGLTGSYWYAVTFRDSTAGVETGPSANLATNELFLNVKPVAQNVQLTITAPSASEPRMTTARIYRSGNDSLTLFYLGEVAIVPGGPVVVYTDDGSVTDAVLGTRTEINKYKRFNSDGLPPKSHTGEFYKGRLFIVDPDIPNKILYSEANLPEDFPTTNTTYLQPSEGDPNPYVVAIRANHGQLFAYTRKGVYLLSSTGSGYAVTPVIRGTGSQSTTATIYIEGLGVIFPGQDRIWLHMGGDSLVALGTPPDWPDANPVDDLFLDVDYGVLPQAFAGVYQEENQIMMAVPERGVPVNARTFVLEYARVNWSMDTERIATCMGRWMGVAGREQPVRGDDMGNVWQDELGNSEGVYSATFSGVVTAVTRNTLSVAGLDMTGVPKGTPVFVKNTTTGAILFRNRFVSYAGGVLTVMEPFTSLPDVGTTVEVGSIEGVWESGFFSLMKNRAVCFVERVICFFLKGGSGSIRMLGATDQNSSQRAIANALLLNRNQSRVKYGDRGSQVQLRFEGSTPGTDWGIEGFDVEYTSRDYRT